MKNKQSRADLEAIRSSVLRVTDLLTEIIDQMKTSGTKEILIHTKDAENKHIPALWKWGLKARSEAELQLALNRSDKKPRAASKPAKGKAKPAKRAAAPARKPPKKAKRRR
jgi:hypothetical protein